MENRELDRLYATTCPELDIDRRTIFSEDRKYRYALWRAWDLANNSFVVFIGLNPSTADETKDDPTIRKCRGFAQRWGYGAICMMNLFAFRATQPREMKGYPKPIGDENDKYLTRYCRDAPLVVAAWGTYGEFMGRDSEVKTLISEMRCLGKTKAGHPRHPLYVPYETKLEPFHDRP